MINSNSKLIAQNDEKYMEIFEKHHKDIEYQKSLDLTKLTIKMNQSISEVSNLKEASVKLALLERDMNLKLMEVDKNMLKN